MGFYDQLKNPVRPPDEQERIARLILEEIKKYCVEHKYGHRMDTCVLWTYHPYCAGNVMPYFGDHQKLMHYYGGAAPVEETDGVLSCLRRLLAEEGFPDGCVRREILEYGTAKCPVIGIDIGW